MDKHLETASNEEKMKWLEEYVEAQRQDLQQAKHQILLFRQNTLREYSDYMAVSSLNVLLLLGKLADLSDKSVLVLDLGFDSASDDRNLSRYYFA